MQYYDHEARFPVDMSTCDPLVWVCVEGVLYWPDCVVDGLLHDKGMPTIVVDLNNFNLWVISPVIQ